jgi:transcriptional regulator with XRE-family HTH domain
VATPAVATKANGTHERDVLFGRTLQVLRLGRRLSIRRLAGLVGVSPSYISRIERGEFPPPATSAITRLSRVLEVERELLLMLSDRVPEDVLDVVRQRSRLVARLLRAAKRYSDDELEQACRALEMGPTPHG